jgi:hypothetical protein
VRFEPNKEGRQVEAGSACKTAVIRNESEFMLPYYSHLKRSDARHDFTITSPFTLDDYTGINRRMIQV